MKIRIKIPWKEKEKIRIPKHISKVIDDQGYYYERGFDWDGLLTFILPIGGAFLAGWIYHSMGGSFWLAAAIEFPIGIFVTNMFRTTNCWGSQ